MQPSPTLALAAALFILVPAVPAQSLLVPDSNQRVIMQFDATTGALINPVAIDLMALTGGLARTPIEVLEAPHGELWVSDQIADTIFRLSGDGSTFLGTVSAPLDACRGMALSGPGVLIANSGSGNGASGDTLVQLGSSGDLIATTPVGDPLDVEPFTFHGVPGYLVSDIDGEDLVFAEGANLSNQTIFHASMGITGIDSPQQIHVSSTGRVFAASSITPVGVFEYSSTGTEIDYIDVGALAGLGGARGVFMLGNGNLLISTVQGVHVYDTVTGTISTEISGVSPRFIAFYGRELCPCTTYCSANPNSTGLPGAMSATGVSFAAQNEITLVASQLPPLSFGYFITSQTQGFVMNPSGSAGNLCLSGAIGRYVAPGQIMNSGGSGVIMLDLDLAQTPQPLGLVAVTAGEIWNFQCWHRDTVAGQVTSNFTGAISISFQ